VTSSNPYRGLFGHSRNHEALSGVSSASIDRRSNEHRARSHPSGPFGRDHACAGLLREPRGCNAASGDIVVAGCLFSAERTDPRCECNVDVFGEGRVGVYAKAATPAGTALYTNGKIKFYGRSGRTYVTAGHNYRDVTIAGMTTSSAVIATLQTNRTGFYVQSVISYSGKFRLYLNKIAPGATWFSYIVIG